MDNAIYQFMDCDGTKDGPPKPYAELSQIADFSTAEAAPQREEPEPRTRKFYPGVLDSKYMQAVVRGGREGLLQFRVNPQRTDPVPYPWPEWFDHETGSPAGKKRQRGYPEGCTSQKPAAVPGCGGGGGGGRPVPSMYDPPPCAAATAAANAAAQHYQPAPPPDCQPVVVMACQSQEPQQHHQHQQHQQHQQHHQQQHQQPPPFVRAANEEHCIPCSAAPEVWSDPVDPRADCTPYRPPPQQNQQHRQRHRPSPPSTDKNFVPSYLHEPENMAKIIAHDYQRQWVDERDTWEGSHATSNDNQRIRMQNRCSNQERK